MTSANQRCGVNLFLAFIRRDISIEKTYRFHLALKICGILLQMVIFYFISVYMGKPEYFPFVFVGIMFSSYFQFWLNVFSENIRQEQYWGTMEKVFLSPIQPLIVIAASASGKFMIVIMETAAMILVGKLFFGAGFAGVFSILAVFIPILVLNALVFGGIGLISGSFIMYFKRGDPVNWVIGASFDLLSGVFFPVAVFPDLLKGLAEKLPTTMALNMWRTILLDGNVPVLHDWLVLAGWATVLCGFGILSFKISFDKTRIKGELGSY